MLAVSREGALWDFGLTGRAQHFSEELAQFPNAPAMMRRCELSAGDLHGRQQDSEDEHDGAERRGDEVVSRRLAPPRSAGSLIDSPGSRMTKVTNGEPCRVYFDPLSSPKLRQMKTYVLGSTLA